MYILTLLTCLFLFTPMMVEASPTSNNKIDFVEADLCPYICKTQNGKQGFVFDCIQYLLDKHNYSVSLQFVPLARAIKDVETGKFDGILKITKDEAPNLGFTSRRIIDYKMCFYTSSNNTWRFNGLDNLQHTVIGLTKGQQVGEPYTVILKIQPRMIHSCIYLAARC